MKNIKLNNLKKISVLDADKIYKDLNISFIIRDGKLKGLSN